MWPAPDPRHACPCPYIRAWIGLCGKTNRFECNHSRNFLTKEPRDERCSARVMNFDELLYERCDKPAIEECSFAGQFVCGRPICDTCRCPGVGH